MYEQNGPVEEWLSAFVGAEGGVAGAVHVQRDADLFLVAAHNLPPKVVEVVTFVPHGKGMAGVAQVRRAPVQTCNLQTDTSGHVKPGARAVDAQAAVALPVLDGGGQVRAVVGIAFAHEGEIPAARERELMEKAAMLPL